MIYPPSPALSACDSLDGIDDLDAFLALQGGLSHFPTPPLKSDARDPGLDVTRPTHTHHNLVQTDPVANAFAIEASTSMSPDAYVADAIHHMLVRADLPLEVVAVAFSLILALRQDPADLLGCPPDLLSVAALRLAVSYTDDHAPIPAWYSRHVCRCSYTAQTIDATALQLLAALDWHIHKFTTSEALDQAMFAFCSSTAIGSSALSTPDHDIGSPSILLEIQPLKLVTSDTSIVHWENGAYTPDITPPCSALDDTRTEMQFLPLL
ncbi:Putative Cyclin-like superfamily [Septoria linicola]|uniref:Cyclin-like superfamily n=1 Tax=Septoria linicola TaxID=215465 RepID=A0A9Q9AV43_9PEZI|nr:Putative Cyclin-like superfamily [Septoria linicola]